MSKEPYERALLQTSAKWRGQGRCAWDGIWLFAAYISSSSALLRFDTCSHASSVLLCQNKPRVCQKSPRTCQNNHVKQPDWPYVVAMYKAAVLETENDLLWFDPHCYLLFCVFTPVAARTQCSYVKNKNLAYVKKSRAKEPYCKPAQNGGGKAAVLETVYDSLQLTYHRLLLFCILAPVAARPQCSYVKTHLEYVKRDLEYPKRSMWKSPTDHKS